MTYGHLQLTACTPGSAPGPTLGIEYGKPLPLPFYPICNVHTQKYRCSMRVKTRRPWHRTASRSSSATAGLFVALLRCCTNSAPLHKTACAVGPETALQQCSYFIVSCDEESRRRPVFQVRCPTRCAATSPKRWKCTVEIWNKLSWETKKTVSS